MASRVESRRSDGSLPVVLDEAFATSPQSGLTWFCFLLPGCSWRGARVNSNVLTPTKSYRSMSFCTLAGVANVELVGTDVVGRWNAQKLFLGPKQQRSFRFRRLSTTAKADRERRGADDCGLFASQRRRLARGLYLSPTLRHLFWQGCAKGGWLWPGRTSTLCVCGPSFPSSPSPARR